MSESKAETASAAAHLQSIGRLCLAWAILNRKVTDLASVLIGAGPETTACLFPGSENMKPRCESIKKLVVFLMPGNQMPWRDRVTDLINDIQTGMARERNRLVHDEWVEMDGAISRVETGAYIDRSKPARGLRIDTAKWHTDTTADVDDLIGRIEDATHMIALAVLSAAKWQRGGQPPEPFWI